MDKFKLTQLGWVVSACLFGIIVAGGFQNSTEKFAVADLPKVAEGSDYFSSQQQIFNDYAGRRKNLLDFFNQYKVATSDQEARIEVLSLKTDATPAEKAELDRLQQDVIAQDKRYKELTIKASPSPEEQQALTDFANRTRAMDGTVLPKLASDFQDQIQQMKDQIQQTAFQKATDAVRQIGKDQSFTLIFSTAAAPYGANDLTDQAIKAMNAATPKKPGG